MLTKSLKVNVQGFLELEKLAEPTKPYATERVKNVVLISFKYMASYNSLIKKVNNMRRVDSTLLFELRAVNSHSCSFIYRYLQIYILVTSFMSFHNFKLVNSRAIPFIGYKKQFRTQKQVGNQELPISTIKCSV